MTLPRLIAMKEFWRENPPVRVMLQAKFGFKTPASKVDDVEQIITDPEKALMMMPGISEGLGGGLGYNG